MKNFFLTESKKYIHDTLLWIVTFAVFVTIFSTSMSYILAYVKSGIFVTDLDVFIDILLSNLWLGTIGGFTFGSGIYVIGFILDFFGIGSKNDDK